MSSRALRKAQREKEEQERLAQLEQEAKALEDEEAETEEDEAPVAPKKSAFAMLQDEEDEAQDEVDEEEDTIKEEPVASIQPKTTSSKKKKKKKRGKGGGNAAAQDEAQPKEEVDEIDAALKELSTNGKGSAAATTRGGVDPVLDEMCRLLSVDTNHLHASNEMRRLFGRAALETDREEQIPQGAMGGNRRQQRAAQQVGLREALRGHQQGGRSGGLAAMALRRNIFIQGKEEWPVATGGGLGMEIEEKRADGIVMYKFVHNTAYQDVQAQFESCVASMDPNRMIVLLQHNPYHISTLLQVSEIAKQERDHTTSGDLLERALFSFGRAIHSTFAKNLAEGKARLDFRRAENREFWLASWRYIQNLTMRATWRTVYEWAKMLLSLDPANDPYGLWLVLDQYALRCKQDLDYVNLSRNAVSEAVHRRMPNVLLSQGLAEHRAGNRNKGKQLLFSVIGKYPWMVAAIMHELNIDAPPAIWGKEARSEKETLFAQLYATRAKDLWNTPENSNLLIEISSAIPPDTPAAPTDTSQITQSVARHVILSDVPALIALVPRHFTNQLESASDPLPPDDAFMSYLGRREPSMRGRMQGMDRTDIIAQLNQLVAGQEAELRELRGLSRFFRELFPWYDRYQESGGAETASDGASEVELPATAEELMQQVRDAGVNEDEFLGSARRLIELQNQWNQEEGRAVDTNATAFDRLVTHPQLEPDEDMNVEGLNRILRESGLRIERADGREQQARVEDGEESEDDG